MTNDKRFRDSRANPLVAAVGTARRALGAVHFLDRERHALDGLKDFPDLRIRDETGFAKDLLTLLGRTLAAQSSAIVVRANSISPRVWGVHSVTAFSLLCSNDVTYNIIGAGRI